jgi:hypothetical protein
MSVVTVWPLVLSAGRYSCVKQMAWAVYCARKPPSIASVCPVTMPAAGLAR